MAAVYSKEFLLDAFCFRYDLSGLNTRAMRVQADSYYDTVEKKKFREAASLDAEELAKYQEFCLEHSIEY
jgi:hypothetical protein